MYSAETKELINTGLKGMDDWYSSEDKWCHDFVEVLKPEFKNVGNGNYYPTPIEKIEAMCILGAIDRFVPGVVREAVKIELINALPQEYKPHAGSIAHFISVIEFNNDRHTQFKDVKALIARARQ